MKRLLPELALPRPPDVFHVSPEGAPKRTLIQATVTTRDFMSTRPNSEAGSNDASRDQPLARGCAIWLDGRSARNAQLLITTMMLCSVTRVTS
jgi:hypothetical protein